MSFFSPIRTAETPKIAYFSMEFAVDARIPNYAGGLGVLASDILYSAADTNYPIIGIGLIYHQHEDPEKKFHPEFFMKKLPQTVKVKIENREVTVGGYQYDVITPDGKTVPIYFLTTFSGDNEKWDRDITKNLYPDNGYFRIAQEVVLGIGGVKMCRALGHHGIEYFHLNEGHAAFATLELLKEKNWDDASVRKISRFTTHTPIPAGHDKFDYDLAYKVAGDQIPWHIKKLATDPQLSMTDLAINLSGRTNAVSKKHQLVCFDMFPGKSFESITNGVHLVRWASEPTKNCLDKYLPKWRNDPLELTKSMEVIPNRAVQEMREKNKTGLIDWINQNPAFFHFESDFKDSDRFDPEICTIVFARRFVPYKRPLLIFQDMEKLRKIGNKKIQLIFAGHCHPNDHFCSSKQNSIRAFAHELRDNIRIAVIPNYNLDIAKKLVSGANIWLNNPIPPLEASGTSGMKAAINGVLNCSLLDGWWIEGFKKNPNAGWGFGENFSENPDPELLDKQHAEALYEQIEKALAIYYQTPEQWLERCKHAISLGAYFNTHRVLQEYDEIMWRP